MNLPFFTTHIALILCTLLTENNASKVEQAQRPKLSKLSVKLDDPYLPLLPNEDNEQELELELYVVDNPVPNNIRLKNAVERYKRKLARTLKEVFLLPLKSLQKAVLPLKETKTTYLQYYRRLRLCQSFKGYTEEKGYIEGEE